jgi:hypothetical protein
MTTSLVRWLLRVRWIQLAQQYAYLVVGFSRQTLHLKKRFFVMYSGGFTIRGQIRFKSNG